MDEGNNDSKWWRRTVELAAFVAVPPALAYTLGLGVLWVQLANEYDSESRYATWYAASLAPTTVAAGFGIGVIWKALVASLATAFLLLIIYWLAKRRSSSDSQSVRGTFWVPFGSLVLGLMLGAAGAAINTTPPVFSLRVFSGFIVVYLLMFYVFWGLGDESRSAVRNVVAFYPNLLYKTIGALGIIWIGVFLLFPGESRPPCIWKADPQGEVVEAEVPLEQQATEPNQWTLEGGLVAHTDSTWYMFDEDKRLKAVPDGEARRLVAGEFYVAYIRIGENGEPVGEKVTEEDLEPGLPYSPVESCTNRPGSTVTYSFND